MQHDHPNRSSQDTPGASGEDRCPGHCRPLRRTDIPGRALRGVLDPVDRPSSPRNIFNVMRQVSIYGLLAIGMTFVILTGGIDLSVGSVLALAGLVCAAVEKGSTGLLTALGPARRAAWACALPIVAAVLIGLLAACCKASPSAGSRCRPSSSRSAVCPSSGALALVFSEGQPISAFRGLHLVGPGYDRSGPGAGDPVPGLRRRRLHRSALYEVRALHLRGRRQPGSSPAIRARTSSV